MRTMMKTAFLTGIRELEIRQRPIPSVESPDDVLLRVRRVGVCGSDVHYYTTGRIGSQVVQFPYPVGHEMAGEVVEVGDGVADLQPGTRVAVDPAVSCGRCDQCLSGRKHTCRTLKFLGCPGQMEGCLSEYIVMPAQCCFPIPDAMSYDQAAISEPLSIGLYATRLAGGLAGKSIAILGSGPIGLSVLLPAVEQRAEKTFVTDRLDYRCGIALEHGATWAGNPDTVDVLGDIQAAEPNALDVVFECCGEQTALDQGMHLLKPGGTLMIVGIPEADRMCYSPDIARRHELTLQNVRRQNECVQPALDLISSGAVDPDSMITHEFPLDECKQAFDLVDQYADGVVKAMIHM